MAKPSLAEAIKFYKWRTLPRRVPAEDKQDAGNGYRLALPDEVEHSELFPVWTTGPESLACFGIGVGLYFHQLLWLALAFFIYGLLSTYTMYYYATTYDNTNDTSGLIAGSAECSDVQEVSMTNCPADVDVRPDGTCDGLYTSSCNELFWSGMLDFVGMVLVIVYSFYLKHAEAKETEALDMAVQTAQDYSVVAHDPEPEDDDPEEWKRFFSQFGEVVYVTICRANERLTRVLTERRIAQHNINLLSPLRELNPLAAETDTLLGNAHRVGSHGAGGGSINGLEEAARLGVAEDMEQDEAVPWLQGRLQGLGLRRDLSYYEKKVTELDAQVDKLTEPHEVYPVCKVFAVFQTEQGQRKCLNALSTGLVQSKLDLVRDRPEAHIFKGTNVLDVREPVEPSDVMWHNLELKRAYRVTQNILGIMFTLGVVVLAGFGIYIIKSRNLYTLAIGVSIINYALPTLCYMITARERHMDATNTEGSLLFKLVVSRFMNSAFIIYLTTPWEKTLSAENLRTIQALLVSDAIYSPTLCLMNISFMQKLARSWFASTQVKMNSHFTGTRWSLAERYTSMSKTVFTALFFSSLFPAGMFFAALSFLYTFLVDRFLLLRAWARQPQYDATLARRARRHVLFAAMVHLVVTANWYAGWPFDDAMPNGDGTFTYVNKNQVSDTSWEFIAVLTMPWMNDTHRQLVQLYGWVGSGLLAVLVSMVVVERFCWMFRRLFLGSYVSVGEATEYPFTCPDNGDMDAYIPLSVPANNSLIGTLVAAHAVGVNRAHFPDLSRPDTAVGDRGHDDANMLIHNLAYTLPPHVRPRVLGTVHGFLDFDPRDVVNTSGGKNEATREELVSAERQDLQEDLSYDREKVRLLWSKAIRSSMRRVKAAASTAEDVAAAAHSP